jgi:hypothetical protein
METKLIPTIKGVFVNSHIARLRKDKGDAGIHELEKRYNKNIDFATNEDVPIREEVKILEIIIDILKGEPLSLSKRSFQAGQLHFQNFAKTTFAKILFASVAKNSEGFEKLFLNSDYIVNNVFKNTDFKSKKISDGKLKIIMSNNDYPIEHFHGLFDEWVKHWNLKNAKVEANVINNNKYEYLIIYIK